MWQKPYKTKLVVEICNLDNSYMNIRGRLYYKSSKELKELLERLRKKQNGGDK